MLIILKQLSISKILSRNIIQGIFLFIISTLLLSQPKLAYAQTNEDTKLLQKAYQQWGNKNYTKAATIYASIKGYDARMGEGASCFRNDKIECAISAFSVAAWVAVSDRQRGQAAYNLANSFFKLGDFKSAINLYQDALRYQPEKNDYNNNLMFSREVQRNIERHKRLLASRNNPNQKGAGDIETTINFDNERISTLDTTQMSKRKGKLRLEVSEYVLSEEQLAMYMQRSQKYARLQSEGMNFTKLAIKQTPKSHDWSRFGNENPEVENIIKFWQRLFELEENIPAHRESPQILPGVQPW